MNYQEIASASALLKTELAPMFEKLGQGSEWGFALFVKQAYVNAITSCLWIIPGVFCLWLATKIYKLKSEVAYEDFEVFMLKWVGSISFLIVGMLLILIPLSNLISVLINPEYKAIMLILETIK